VRGARPQRRDAAQRRDLTVYAHLGTVLNAAEVRQAGIVPPSFLWDEERHTKGPGHGREDSWTVQGNDLATWWVERGQP
jgi:hypothetical protein